MEREYLNIILAEWSDVERFAKRKEWLPCDLEGNLGCGSFGCVYSTNDDEVVFKVTTDATEVKYLQYGFDLSGVVKLYAWMPFQSRYHDESLYGIWRQRVTPLPKLSKLSDELYRALYDMENIARSAYVYEKNGQKSPRLDDYYFNAYIATAEALAAFDDTEELGLALIHLFNKGVLMGDVKHENMGVATQRGKEMIVLMDVGVNIKMKSM